MSPSLAAQTAQALAELPLHEATGTNTIDPAHADLLQDVQTNFPPLDIGNPVPGQAKATTDITLGSVPL
ncbi:MAG: hypothetical protein KKC51_14010 [Verrucomicrobia bacterium]|nr:hypothetical protein [Verrucomicrobiota bacterium]